MNPSSAPPPVFVDSSGRRHRRIRVIGAALAVPAVAYLVVLVSSMLGGPAPDTQFIPLPGNDRVQSEQRTKVKPTPSPTDSSTGPERPDESRTPDPSATPTTTPTQDPSVTPTPTQTQTPGPTTRTTPTPTKGSPATPGHGKPTVAPGRTKSPSKP